MRGRGAYFGLSPISTKGTGRRLPGIWSRDPTHTSSSVAPLAAPPAIVAQTRPAAKTVNDLSTKKPPLTETG
jgi:hypothetical protein